MSDRANERGAVTIPAIASIAVLLLCFVLVSQFAVWLYAKGALRAAVQSAARSAAPLDSPARSCERAFDLTRRQLLGGQIGTGVGEVRCVIAVEHVTVEVDAHFDSWLPSSPGWDTTVSAVAVREVEPT